MTVSEVTPEKAVQTAPKAGKENASASGFGELLAGLTGSEAANPAEKQSTKSTDPAKGSGTVRKNQTRQEKNKDDGAAMTDAAAAAEALVLSGAMIRDSVEAVLPETADAGKGKAALQDAESSVAEDIGSVAAPQTDVKVADTASGNAAKVLTESADITEIPAGEDVAQPKGQTEQPAQTKEPAQTEVTAWTGIQGGSDKTGSSSPAASASSSVEDPKTPRQDKRADEAANAPVPLPSDTQSAETLQQTAGTPEQETASRDTEQKDAAEGKESSGKKQSGRDTIQRSDIAQTDADTAVRVQGNTVRTTDTVLTSRSAQQVPLTQKLVTSRQTLAEDVSSLLQKSAAKLAQTGKSLEITLSPENLGKLSVRMTVESGKASFIITAARPETLHILARQSGELGQIITRNTGEETLVYTPRESQQESGQQMDLRQQNQNKQDLNEENRERSRRRQQRSEAFADQMRLGML